MQKLNTEGSSVEFTLHRPWKWHAIFKEVRKKFSRLEFLRRQRKHAVLSTLQILLCGAHLAL